MCKDFKSRTQSSHECRTQNANTPVTIKDVIWSNFFLSVFEIFLIFFSTVTCSEGFKASSATYQVNKWEDVGLMVYFFIGGPSCVASNAFQTSWQIRIQFALFNDTWSEVSVKIFSVMYDHTFSKLANHHIRPHVN